MLCTVSCDSEPCFVRRLWRRAIGAALKFFLAAESATESNSDAEVSESDIANDVETVIVEKEATVDPATTCVLSLNNPAETAASLAGAKLNDTRCDAGRLKLLEPSPGEVGATFKLSLF